MSKAIVTLPEGQFTFDTETGWSGKWSEIVAILNRDYPPGTKPPTMFAYLAEPDMAPAYAVAEVMGGMVIVIRDEPPEDELPEPGVVERGGPGSGHHGHKGIPKHRGGSLPSGRAPAPEPEKPKVQEREHGKALNYKRRFSGKLMMTWPPKWPGAVKAKNDRGDPEHWRVKEAYGMKKRLNRMFADLASIYWRNPMSTDFAGDWFTFFRKELETGGPKWFGGTFPFRAALGLAQDFGPYKDAEQAMDATADWLAAEFSDYYDEYLKGREVGARLSEKRGDWAKSKKFMPPTKDFFSIPGTERWDPVRAGLQAMADAGIRLPESWKARYSSPTDEGLLPVKETRGTSLWGRYTDMAGMADSIAINLTDIRSEGETSATMVHEVGHMIEHLGFDWGDGAKFPAVESYYSAVKASGYPERIRGAHYPRISRQVEVFARGFMQYTTSKLRKASPTAQKRNKAFIERMEANVVKAQMPDEPPLYYSWDEFEGVEAAMDKMFEVGIWRK
jgi:hypothetical protein